MPSTITIDSKGRLRNLIADLNSDDNTYKVGNPPHKTTREEFILNPEQVLKSYGITIDADNNNLNPKWLSEEIEDIRKIIEKIDGVKTKFPPIPNAIKDLRGPKGQAGAILPADDDDLMIS